LTTFRAARFTVSTVKQEKSKQKSFSLGSYFTCFASKRNSKNLKQIKREMKQKRRKTKNVKQNNAEKPILEAKGKIRSKKLGNLSF
jgi:hypothetical protein